MSITAVMVPGAPAVGGEVFRPRVTRLELANDETVSTALSAIRLWQRKDPQPGVRHYTDSPLREIDAHGYRLSVASRRLADDYDKVLKAAQEAATKQGADTLVIDDLTLAGGIAAAIAHGLRGMCEQEIFGEGIRPGDFMSVRFEEPVDAPAGA
ncbi:MAG TPA: hypothetical protein VLF40_04430 [Candidatus Saccharimonadales bacterium]|nr:hypothetical protein [Candidatus Saccharimonadales bacterium]